MSTVYGEIEARRRTILKTWRASLDGASGASHSSAARNANRFTDSVTYLVDEATSDVVTWLVGERGLQDVPESLVDICRLKAVQDASPSLALRFIFDLKQVIRSTLGNSVGEKERDIVLGKVDARIDELALFAFDRYAEFRDQLSQIRIDEIRRGEGIMKKRLASEHAPREREAV